MTSKPTKQQLLDVLNNSFVPNQIVTPQDYVNALVRAGLAEEPREAGVYPVKVPTPFGTAALFHVAFWDGREWWAVERGGRLPTPSVVGERISPPSEE